MKPLKPSSPTLSDMSTEKLERTLERVVMMPVRKAGTVERIATALERELLKRRAA